MTEHIQEVPEEPLPSDVVTHDHPPRSPVRKPLPPGSPYSPPNSPRTSMVIPGTTIFFDNTHPNPPLIAQTRSSNVAISLEIASTKEDSLKTVSLTSTSDPSNQDTPPPPTKTPKETHYSRYPYRALYPIPEGVEIAFERMTLSDDDFAMRPKSVGTFGANRKLGRRMGWWIMVLAILIIVIIVAVLAAVGLSRSVGLTSGMLV